MLPPSGSQDQGNRSAGTVEARTLSASLTRLTSWPLLEITELNPLFASTHGTFGRSDPVRAVRQVSVNLKALKSFRVCSRTTVELN